MGWQIDLGREKGRGRDWRRLRTTTPASPGSDVHAQLALLHISSWQCIGTPPPPQLAPWTSPLGQVPANYLMEKPLSNTMSVRGPLGRRGRSARCHDSGFRRTAHSSQPTEPRAQDHDLMPHAGLDVPFGRRVLSVRQEQARTGKNRQESWDGHSS
jgi:hypothetical protein